MNRLTPSQVFCLLFMMNSGNLNSIIAALIPTAGFAAVLGLAACIGTALVVVWMAFKLMRRLPTGDWFADGAAIVGKAPHRTAVAVFLLYFLLRSAIELRGVSYQVISIYLPKTPDAAITAMFALVAGFAIRYGFMSISYFTQYFALYLFPAFLIVVGFSFSMPLKYDMIIALLTHLGTQEAPKAVLSGIVQAHWLAECILILFVAAKLSDMKKAQKAAILVLALYFIQAGSHFISILLSFGPSIVSNMAFPLTEQLRFIRVSDFLENMDPFLLILLFPIFLIKLSVYLYMATLMTAQLLNMKDHRPLAFSITTLSGVLSFQFASRYVEIAAFIQLFWTWFAWFVVCIPIVYLIAAKLRGIQRRTEAGDQALTSQPQP
ncbi:GerAB/ArcD/ProY family transporter [Paenibacillus sp. PL2-23]|uniref:GerAB/ArcD/ProY family transporter n=1 Tax=Paenibacillus sp. PL2-23 TaxID=2100729 RepID=UPI0030FBDA39